MTGYRVVRKDRKGTPWFLSTTSPGYRPLVIEGGKEVRVPLDPTVYLTLRSPLVGSTIRAQMCLLGKTGANRHGSGRHVKSQVGLSIYRDGKRLPIGYRVLDQGGRVITSGTMAYG